MTNFNDLVERYQQENGKPVPNLCKVLEVLPNEVFHIISHSWIYKINHKGDFEYLIPGQYEWRRSDDINTLEGIIHDPSDIKLPNVPSNTALATLYILRRDFNLRWLGMNEDRSIIGFGNQTPEYRAKEWYGVQVAKFEIYPVWMQELMEWHGNLVDTAPILCRNWYRREAINDLIKETKAGFR